MAQLEQVKLVLSAQQAQLLIATLSELPIKIGLELLTSVQAQIRQQAEMADSVAKAQEDGEKDG